MEKKEQQKKETQAGDKSKNIQEEEWKAVS